MKLEKKTPLQLENSLNLEKIETVDSKIKNFQILVTKRKDLIGAKRKMQKKNIR